MRRTVIAMTTAILLLGGIARAQDQSLKIGVCNPNRVWEGMEERKKIQEATVAKRDSLKIEAARRQTEVNELKKQRDALKPESAQYREKSKLVAEKEIEFAVWLRVTDMDLAREEKEQIKALFERITEATRPC
jgi:Skp family chaperone for outer membrane proteins